MVLAKLTSKGQITIPREIRRELGVQTGDQIAFQKDSRGNIIVAKVEVTIKGVAGDEQEDIHAG